MYLFVRYILAPAFDLQRALRQRLLGVKHWEGEEPLSDGDLAPPVSGVAVTSVVQPRDVSVLTALLHGDGGAGPRSWPGSASQFAKAEASLLGQPDLESIEFEPDWEDEFQY